MPKRSSSRKKIPTEVWVALIGLVGVIATAILASPVIVKLIEQMPTPTLVAQPSPGATASTALSQVIIPTAMPLPASAGSGCVPAAYSELSPQSIAVVQPEDSAVLQVQLGTLAYEKTSRLTLASGAAIEFKRMRSIALSNKDYRTRFSADALITLLDCQTHQDVIQSKSGSFLTGTTAFGAFELHILNVKRVDFR